MDILPNLTQLEQDLSFKNELVLRVGAALNHLATVATNAHAEFWAMDTQRLLDMFNADVAVTLATFSSNTAMGAGVNPLLELLSSIRNPDGSPRFPARCPMEMGRKDIVFDGSAFVCLPPPPVEYVEPLPQTPETLPEG